MTAIQTPPGSTAAIDPQSAPTVDALLERARRIAPVIRENAEASERERRVTKPVLEALRTAGFQGLLAPRSLGGLEVDPVTCFRVVEELARSDSAAAWALQSGNVNAWWASRLPEAGIEEVYVAHSGSLVVAAFHPPQQAVEVNGGYRVTGRTPLASMIDDSAWILVSALIMEHGQPRMTPFGPAMVGVMMQTSEVKILDTWHSLGMKGTDSNDAEFSDVFVPAQRSFLLTPEYERGKHFGGPLYRYPAIPIIALFSAAVLLSTARGSIDEFRALAERKVPMGSMKSVRDRGVVQAALAESEALLRSARAFFVGTLDEAWDRTTSGQPHTMEHRADLLLAGINAARAAALVTDTMQRLAGTSGMYTKSALDRYFRDAHTLRNHGFASESKLESVGQVYLGLQPDFPLMMF